MITAVSGPLFARGEGSSPSEAQAIAEKEFQRMLTNISKGTMTSEMECLQHSLVYNQHGIRGHTWIFIISCIVKYIP